MTGVLQTYARKYDFPIDQLKIDFTMSNEFIDQEDVEKDHREFRKDVRFYFVIILSVFKMKILLSTNRLGLSLNY